MNVLWIFAHPEPRSLNGALRDFGIRTLETAGHQVRQSDLYAMNWKAVADVHDFAEIDLADRLVYASASYRAFKDGTQAVDVAAEQAKLIWADVVLIQFPLWWFSAPAILKGWLDQVLAAGWAYRVTDPANPGRTLRYGEGNLAGRRGMLIVSTGATAASLGPRGVAGDIDDLLFPINYGIFWYTGMAALQPHLIHAANRIDADTYDRLEADLAHRLSTIGTAAPIAYRAQNGGDYNSDLVLSQATSSQPQGLTATRLRQGE